QLEKAVINGLKYDNGRVRQMRGIRNFIQTNVATAGGAPISVDMLNDTAQKIYKNGGFASGGRYVIVVPAKQKVAISSLSNDKIRITQSESSRGQVVDYLQNDFGRFQIVMNDNLKSDELLFIDANRIAI
ncbi:SU10 major capsid protein, partial [Staphylococcus pasteuri]